MEKTKEEILRGLSEELVRVTHMLRSLDKKAVDFGTGELLNPFEIHLIDAVGRRAGRTVTQLAEWFLVTKGAISQVAGKLVKAGYVIKRRNPENGKEILLSLTRKGEVAMTGHEEFHRELNREILSVLGDVSVTEMRKMNDILVRISRRLENSINLDIKRTGGF